jgi:hypothetical protein
MAIRKMELSAPISTFEKRMDIQIQKAPTPEKKLPFTSARATYQQISPVMLKHGFKSTGNEKTTFSFLKSPAEAGDLTSLVKDLTKLFKGDFRPHPRWKNGTGFWLVKDLNGVKTQILVIFGKYPGATENHVYVAVSPYSTKPNPRGFLVEKPQWDE